MYKRPTEDASEHGQVISRHMYMKERAREREIQIGLALFFHHLGSNEIECRLRLPFAGGPRVLHREQLAREIDEDTLEIPPDEAISAFEMDAVCFRS
jgi:hypothetical protein